MRDLKLYILAAFAVFGLAACFASKQKPYVIAESKEYEASIYRQYCTICHGPEAEGKQLQDGKKVPSLRSGEFKFKTEAEIYRQISDGGNGMVPFRNVLSDRELHLMAGFVLHDLRGK